MIDKEFFEESNEIILKLRKKSERYRKLTVLTEVLRMKRLNSYFTRKGLECAFAGLRLVLTNLDLLQFILDNHLCSDQ